MSKVVLIICTMISFIFMILPLLIIIYERITSCVKYKLKWWKISSWWRRIKKYYKNYTFKNRYLYTHASSATIAARRLIKGYFKHSFNPREEFGFNLNPFNYIISVTAKIRRNELTIKVITDKPGLFIGKGGKSHDAIIVYILMSDYYLHSKFSKLNIRIEESNYWPETYEEIRERDEEFSKEYDRDMNNF